MHNQIVTLFCQNSNYKYFDKTQVKLFPKNSILSD